jgi:recombination protein RecR
MNRPQPIEKMIEALRRLPGVGPKMAERLGYHLLKSSPAEVRSLIEAISSAKDLIKQCSRCHNLSESEPCSVCSDASRAQTEICVVETPQDMIAFSRVKEYHGLYFVLGGALSPLDGIGPDDIRVPQLLV